MPKSVLFPVLALASLVSVIPNSAEATDYLCRVKVVNNVQGAVIDRLVCQFYFESGTQYYNDKDVNIGHGEAGYNDSNTNTKCTKRVSTVVRVVYGGQSHAFTHDTGDAGPGQCWILVPLELNPGFRASIDKLKSAKSDTERLAARLVCRTIDPKTGEWVDTEWKAVEDFDAHVQQLRQSK